LTKNLDKTIQGSPHPLDAALDTLPGGTPLELRDRALADLADELRLCADDMVTLNLVDVDTQARTLRVVGEPIAVADGPAWYALGRWLERGRPALVQDADEPALFVSRGGRRLSASDVRRRLRAARRRMGTSQPIQASADPASISTTKTYLRVESKRLRKAYARSHPRA
jgi:site-specific recombinase XerD